MLFSKDSKTVLANEEILIIKTRNFCSGNRSKWPGRSRKSECHFLKKIIFSGKTHNGNSIKLNK